jgi:HAD superfamily hydrolase (TIGR01509 family)
VSVAAPTRAVVFDFDGVIANSEPLHFLGFRDVLAGEGIELSESEYYARYLGYDDAGAFFAVAADRRVRLSSARVVELIARKAVRLEELERDHSVLFPGAADLIRHLAATCPLAIASGAIRPEIERVLDKEGLATYFKTIVAAGETPVSKPAPDPYTRAVTLLSAATGSAIEPRQCVAIEDSRWGLESARAAGLRTIAVTHTYPARALSADAVVETLDALTWAFVCSVGLDRDE